MKYNLKIDYNNRKSAEIIQFPVKAQQKEIKIPSMKCCKTDMMDWNFLRF